MNPGCEWLRPTAYLCPGPDLVGELLRSHLMLKIAFRRELLQRDRRVGLRRVAVVTGAKLPLACVYSSELEVSLTINFPYLICRRRSFSFARLGGVM